MYFVNAVLAGVFQRQVGAVAGNHPGRRPDRHQEDDDERPENLGPGAEAGDPRVGNGDQAEDQVCNQERVHGVPSFAAGR